MLVWQARDAILTPEAVVAPGRRELPPIADADYVALCDPSGGSQDAMALEPVTRLVRLVRGVVAETLLPGRLVGPCSQRRWS